MIVVKEVATYKNRLIYRKTKVEKMKLKTIKCNLDRPFTNTTIIHLNADSDTVTKITRTNKK